jgi:hypothetical protein
VSRVHVQGKCEEEEEQGDAGVHYAVAPPSEDGLEFLPHPGSVALKVAAQRHRPPAFGPALEAVDEQHAQAAHARASAFLLGDEEERGGLAYNARWRPATFAAMMRLVPMMIRFVGGGRDRRAILILRPEERCALPFLLVCDYSVADMLRLPRVERRGGVRTIIFANR